MSDNNLKLWESVQETDPKHTKKAKVGGNQITSISPQYQIFNATREFGPYGSTWGFKNIELDYSLVDTEFKKDKTEGSYPNIKVVGKESRGLGLVVFKAIFFHPTGEFPIINSISLFTNNDMSKIDNDFAKKIETDTLTKALSKLGFNADIFMGRYDDTKYFAAMQKKFKEPVPLPSIDENKFNSYCDWIAQGIKDKKGTLITINYLKERHALTDAQLQELANTEKDVDNK